MAFDGVRSNSHLHMALSTAIGQVLGGHVAAGCTVRTTAEVLLALLPGWAFTREPDAETGFASWWCGRCLESRRSGASGQGDGETLK